MHVTRQKTELTDHSRFIVITPARRVPDLVDDVRDGLLNTPRSLPPKYFYDAHGSWLFDQICNTPEYYPTRTEDRLLLENSQQIIDSTRPDQILELGSGNSRKTRRLFDACEAINHTCDYAPFDVCAEMLAETSDKLTTDYGWLSVSPLVGDYHAGLENLPSINGTRLYVFLGSTIGNFQRDEAVEFIREITRCMQPGDWLLLGADRIKDCEVLDAAYNDSRGITADFNLNILRVLNRELAANFDLDGFRHLAVYNDNLHRIEMYLVAIQNQQVEIRGIRQTIQFMEGDRILTEVSHKFSYEDIRDILADTELRIVQHHEPPNGYFSLILAQYL